MDAIPLSDIRIRPSGPGVIPLYDDEDEEDVFVVTVLWLLLLLVEGPVDFLDAFFVTVFSSSYSQFTSSNVRPCALADFRHAAQAGFAASHLTCICVPSSTREHVQSELLDQHAFIM